MKNVTILVTWEDNVERLDGKNKKTHNSPLWSAVFVVLAWLFLSVTLNTGPCYETKAASMDLGSRGATFLPRLRTMI